MTKDHGQVWAADEQWTAELSLQGGKRQTPTATAGGEGWGKLQGADGQLEKLKNIVMPQKGPR